MKTEHNEEAIQQDDDLEENLDHDGDGEFLEDDSILEDSLDDLYEDSKDFDDLGILIKTEERPYSCNLCKKTFSTKNVLIHHKMWHAGEKPYSCDFCDKKFTQKSNLTQHRRVHTGEKPFSCKICSKAFSTKFSLSSHKLIHTGEKPFACDVCGKAFNKTSNLHSHRKNNHKELYQSNEFNENDGFLDNQDLQEDEDSKDLLDNDDSNEDFDSVQNDSEADAMRDNLDFDIKEQLSFFLAEI